MATTLLSPSAQSDTNNTHSPAPSQSSFRSASTSSTSPSPSTADSPDESKDQLDDSKPSLIHCRWEGCTMTFTNPESIYSHLCDDHVGRKSTGNLCLTCKWVDCEFSCTAKRHHITSHLIVHAPFKPHSCKQCKKSFKRPQDLKKHERTHMQRPTVNYQQLFQAQMMANAPFAYQPQPMVMTTGDGRFYTVSPTAPPPISDAYAMQLHMAQQMAYPQVSYPGLPQQYHHGQQGLYPMLPQQPRSQSESHAPREVDTGAVSPRSKPAQLRSQSTSVPDTSYLALAESGRSKSTSASVPEGDTNSYGYLAHGSSSVAGVKREYEDVGGFFNDVRAKRVAPTYDHAMAQRLCATFGGETIVDPRWMSDESASESGSPAMQPGKTSNASAPNGGKQRLSIPLVLQSNDVAQLNAFLLQLGSSAAGADSSSFDGSSAESMTSGSSAASSPPSSFDFNNALNSYGLTNIPGFDESLLSAPLSCGNAASAEPHQQYDGPSQDYPVSGYNNFTTTLPCARARPIASLPSRAGAPPSYAQSQYARPAYAPLHPPSFDSIRTGRDPALVPQLSPTDAVPHFSYRHVEPLTRADVHPDLASLPKTDATPSTKAPSPRTASPRSRSSSASSASSDSSCSTCVDASDDSGRTTPSSSAVDAAAAQLGTLGLDAAKAEPAVPTPEMRHAHIKLILDLLVAINAPKPVAA